MNKIVAGILAHVDAGKTTLSEALLYTSGSRRKLGRVDHGDAFLDTDVQERERRITIFSKQALFEWDDTMFTLLDTPGHVDFSTEMERTLQVLDCAVLVISGTDGVQGHTRTLWRLLERYELPVFIFVNKMDLPNAGKEELTGEMNLKLSGRCVCFDTERESRDEALALCSEEALQEFLEKEQISDETVKELIKERKVFPCWFGSALKLDGTEDFLRGLSHYAPVRRYPDRFGARVFKITYDAKNTRLTWMKITGGSLKAKSVISYKEGDVLKEEKADQLRIYSGDRFRTETEAGAGSIVAVSGLKNTRAGQGLGEEEDTPPVMIEPVLNYRIILPEGTDPYTVPPKLRLMQEEDPMLRAVWDEQHRQIHVQLMGEVQMEVLKRSLHDRFGIDADFGTGCIIYKETIAAPVIGMGHFEPLRHYAEVHLLMEPGERGSGVKVFSAVSSDRLDTNWQRLILTHLTEREHPGVLTGSPLTDVKITLTAGRAHLKHTEGGDFRQATYRAVRQGLMQAENILLEPFYDFRLEIPSENTGRAMTDLQGMNGVTGSPETQGDMTVLTGYAPVAGLQDYQKEVAVYTRGLGQLSFAFRGYERCADAEKVIETSGYDPEHDAENPAGSVFCRHGSGINVRWDEVREYMHLDSGADLGESRDEEAESPAAGTYRYSGSLEEDRELLKIFERTYSKVEPRSFRPAVKSEQVELKESYTVPDRPEGPEYLLVDGYNIIFAWDELKELAGKDIAAARSVLEDILSNYQGFRKCEVILVFDAYKVKGGAGSVTKKNNIYVVYTKEAQTADSYIERTTYELGRRYKVRVATSDSLEQVIILGHGALRISAAAFKAEVENTISLISRTIEEYNRRNRVKWTIKDAEKLQ